MINIRSTTIGINTDVASKTDLESNIRNFLALSDSSFKDSNISVRTHRLTTSPIGKNNPINDARVQSTARWINDLAEAVGIRWFCLPFNFIEQDFKTENVNILTNILKKFPQAFLNVMVSDEEKINKRSVLSASMLINNVSKISQNGFDNFRLGISSNCKSHTPFFPFSYHEGNQGFSFALEVTESFLELTETHKKEDTDFIRNILIESLKKDLIKINQIGLSLERQTGFKYYGLDSSLAPFPDGHASVGKLIELLGIDLFGSNGTLLMTSYLTNIIKSAIKESRVESVGFNGVMYSVLEDDFLAASAKVKNISLDSLALYSSVCGCGLDMIPLPGDIFDEEIASIIFDICSLSISLSKPLGIRLLPITGKRVKEMTEFNYDFLVDTRVFEIRNKAMSHDFLSENITNLKKYES